MMNAETLCNSLVDELNDLGLPNMAATLDTLVHSPKFMEMDRLTLLSEVIAPEYQDKVSKRINNRLRHAKLIGCPQDFNACTDSVSREYLPQGITDILSSLSFVHDGLNICILGPSDSGKTYLAKAIGIAACREYKVEYHHSEEFMESLVSIKNVSQEKYERRMRILDNLDLLILDDFLLHTIMDEREVKVLFAVLERRCEKEKSTIVCSQREPVSWASMILNDEISANAILKRATKHYTVVINAKNND